MSEQAKRQAQATSGQLTAVVLQRVSQAVAVGVTTGELAQLASRELAALGGQPAFLGYQGFPSVICISVNDEVVHGIPGNRTLAEGDLVGLDFGVTYDGMVTDAAVTVAVGRISPAAERLLLATKQALEAGIAAAVADHYVGDVSAAIEQRLKLDRLGIVRDLVGHGVGESLHQEPEVPNYVRRSRGPKLYRGLTIAIEPMATLGGHDVTIADDGWTIRTADGSLAAHFEHTIRVTDGQPEILTALVV